jgi:hypothetical protein
MKCVRHIRRMAAVVASVSLALNTMPTKALAESTTTLGHAGPYEIPAYVRPSDDSVALNALLEGAGYAAAFNSNWTDIASGNFCGGLEKELVLMKNKHSNFSILRGPAPYPVGGFDFVSSSSHPWKTVAAGNLDADAYDEFVAVRRVTSSGVPDVVVGKVHSDCGNATVRATAIIGNPANSEWVDAAIGNFDGTGKQIALLKASHSNFVLARLTSSGTLEITYSSDLHSNSTQPWKALAAGDIDADGRDELIAARQVSNGRGTTVFAYKWNGTDFQILATSTIGNNGNSDWSSVTVGDFNGDGRAAIALVKNAHSNFIVMDLPTGAFKLRVVSSSDLDSAAGQYWRGLTATDWLGMDQGAAELVAVRAATDPYRADLFVYGNRFHRVSRDTGLLGTRAQFDEFRLPLNASADQVRNLLDSMKRMLTDTHTNTLNWMLAEAGDYTSLVRFLQASKDFAVDGRHLRVWVTLMPLAAEAVSQPENPDETTWNELEYFNAATPGGIGKDLLGWASVFGRLAEEYPHLIALGIDDFNHHPEQYPGEYIAEIESRMRSQAPWMNFVPTTYYNDFKKQSLPDITRTVDSMLFYFRNESHTDGKACLTDPCGQNSIAYFPAEFAFVNSFLPAGRKLQLGTYWSPLYGDIPEIPSNRYDHDLVSLALSMPDGGGVTAYTMGGVMDENIFYNGLVCNEANPLEYKYCIIKKLYRPPSLFNTLANDPNVKTITGDFNGDHSVDIGLVGGPGSNTAPVAFSLGDGKFSIFNQRVGDFAAWAAVPNVKTISGDFNNDGRTDVALIGGDPSWWHTMPVAFSNGDGTFRITNTDVGEFASWAAVPNVRTISGDFNNDGRTDVALIGGDPSWWYTMPIAFSTGDGNFAVTNFSID